MDKKLWIIRGTTGEYSDRSEWPVAVVDCEDDAKLFVEMLHKQYQTIPPAMLKERWKNEESIAAIMSLDPSFQCDYTGTMYFYGFAPHLNRLDIERVQQSPQEALRSPMTEHTPTPWSVCNKGECPCLAIWCPDHPIAKVESGKWGDEYPSIRLVGDSSIDRKAEAYMEQITYGEIGADQAKANALFIVKAVNNHDALVKALEQIRDDILCDPKHVAEAALFPVGENASD